MTGIILYVDRFKPSASAEGREDRHTTLAPEAWMEMGDRTPGDSLVQEDDVVSIPLAWRARLPLPNHL